MSNQTLRELAKDFARGEIDKDDYRQSRAELIKAITEGKTAVKTIDFPPPLMPSDEEAAITETAKRDKTEIVAPSSKKRPVRKEPPAQHSLSEPSKKSPVIFITVSAAIVISLIIVVVLFYPKPPGSTTTETSNKAQTTAAAATASTNMAGESLIAEFLTQKNWTTDNLDTFLNSWSALSQEERDSAKPGKRMQRMHDSIYKQFLEEKALSSIDSEKAAIKQQKLIEFANAIGIDDSRLVLE